MAQATKPAAKKAARKKRPANRWQHDLGWRDVVRNVVGISLIIAALMGIKLIYGLNGHKKPPVADAAAVAPVHDKDSAAAFHKYLVKLISSDSLYAEESFSDVETSGDTARVTGKIAFRVADKQLVDTDKMMCQATVNGSPVTLNISTQSQNDEIFLRLDEARGTVTGTDGKPVDVAQVLAANQTIKGVWYRTLADAKTRQRLEQQLDSGVYIMSFGFFAPNYDADQLATRLVNDRVFEYKSGQGSAGGYVFDVSVNRVPYRNFIQDTFPKVDAQALIDSMYPTGIDIRYSTASVRPDGTPQTIASKTDNLCPMLVKTYLGSTAQVQSPSGLLQGALTIRPSGSFSIAPVVGAKNWQ